MNHYEINEILIQTIQNLIDSGYKKTNIARLLLGASSASPIIKKLNTDNINNIFLGIKPFNKIANLIDYDLHLVFVKKDENLPDFLYETNIKFFNELENVIKNYMENQPIKKQKINQELIDFLGNLLNNDILKNK